MSTIIPYHTTKFYERIDQICVDRYGSSANDVVIYVLNQNPGLEQYGILLPDGIRILLPDLPKQAVTTAVRRQTLPWI